MDEIKETMIKIEELRAQLNELIDKRVILEDGDILSVSKKLDALLNEYFNMLKEKAGKG